MADSRPYQRNASDRRQGAYADRKVKQDVTRLADALRATLRTKDGRIVLHQLLEDCGVFRSPIARDHDETQRAIGMQAIGLALREKVIDADADAYDLMEREHRAFLKNRDAESEAMQQDTDRAATEEGD